VLQATTCTLNVAALLADRNQAFVTCFGPQNKHVCSSLLFRRV